MVVQHIPPPDVKWLFAGKSGLKLFEQQAVDQVRDAPHLEFPHHVFSFVLIVRWRQHTHDSRILRMLGRIQEEEQLVKLPLLQEFFGILLADDKVHIPRQLDAELLQSGRSGCHSLWGCFRILQSFDKFVDCILIRLVIGWSKTSTYGRKKTAN